MAGLEPATPRIRGELSNHLSYTLLIYQDSGARTRDPSAPDRALYQLSYILLIYRSGRTRTYDFLNPDQAR